MTKQQAEYYYADQIEDEAIRRASANINGYQGHKGKW
jgi:hypothetical protein